MRSSCSVCLGCCMESALPLCLWLPQSLSRTCLACVPVRRSASSLAAAAPAGGSGRCRCDPRCTAGGVANGCVSNESTAPAAAVLGTCHHGGHTGQHAAQPRAHDAHASACRVHCLPFTAFRSLSSVHCPPPAGGDGDVQPGERAVAQVQHAGAFAACVLASVLQLATGGGGPVEPKTGKQGGDEPRPRASRCAFLLVASPSGLCSRAAWPAPVRCVLSPPALWFARPSKDSLNL